MLCCQCFYTLICLTAHPSCTYSGGHLRGAVGGGLGGRRPGFQCPLSFLHKFVKSPHLPDEGAGPDQGLKLPRPTSAIVTIDHSTPAWCAGKEAQCCHILQFLREAASVAFR